MLVSIIVPVYKVELYIVRCLDSVLNQTYRQLEVILVDDCSPDRSMNLAKNLIQNSPNSKDLKFIFLQHDQNRGLSAARNTGIKAATGYYIFFLDSDDELPNDGISTLIAASENGTVDVVSGDMKVIKGVCTYSYYKTNIYYENNYDIVKAFVLGRVLMMACNKLIVRENVCERIPFRESIIHEDELWAFVLLNNVSSLKIVKNITYHYFVRSTSITTSSLPKKEFDSLFVIIKEMVSLWKSGSIPSYNENINYIYYKRLIWTMAILKSHVSLKDKYYYFKSFYKLPIGGNGTFIWGIVRSCFINLVYPIRRNLSLWFKKIRK